MHRDGAQVDSPKSLLPHPALSAKPLVDNEADDVLLQQKLGRPESASNVIPEGSQLLVYSARLSWHQPRNAGTPAPPELLAVLHAPGLQRICALCCSRPGDPTRPRSSTPPTAELHRTRAGLRVSVLGLGGVLAGQKFRSFPILATSPHPPPSLALKVCLHLPTCS